MSQDPPPVWCAGPLRAPGDSNLMQASIEQSHVVRESLQSSLSDLGSGDADVQLPLASPSKLMVSLDGSGPANPGLE